MALRTGCGSAEEVWQSTAEEVRQSTALRMLQQAGCIATRLRGVVDLVAVLAPFFRAVARVADCLFWETLPEACPQVRAALVCDAGRKRHANAESVYMVFHGSVAGLADVHFYWPHGLASCQASARTESAHELVSGPGRSSELADCSRSAV